MNAYYSGKEDNDTSNWLELIPVDSRIRKLENSNPFGLRTRGKKSGF
jgi:hypothetical protein